MKELEKIIFSLIIARLDGDKILDNSYIKWIEKLIRDGIGGFILFGGELEETKKFLSFIQSISSQNLIIASDIEKGVGQQIKGGTIIPSQMAVSAGFDLEKDEDELRNLYSIVANEALNIGINLALIPVLDVNTEEKNPIICTRAFSDDPEIVSELGKFVIKVFKSCGLATCGKHFPGHGATKIDSHLNLPVVLDDLNLHLEPFKRAIKEGVPAIMVGHLLLPKLDTKPATLSEKVTKKLLKGDLDFKGLILTDAMNMKALKDYSYPHSLALRAGADIILHPEDPYETVKEIWDAYRKGLIEETQIMDAVKRVDNFRKNMKIRTDALQPLKDKNSFIHKAFKKAITVLKNENLPIKRDKIIPYLSGFYDKEVEKLFENHFGCVFHLDKFKKTDFIPLLAIFTNIKAGGREYEITSEEIELINKIISTDNPILVSFGNPYFIRNLSIRKAKKVVLVYDSNEPAVSAFLDLFNEGLTRSGKLPVRIDREK